MAESSEMSGTLSGWSRLIEELVRQKAGKFVVVVDGRKPISVSRISTPFRLEDREDKKGD